MQATRARLKNGVPVDGELFTRRAVRRTVTYHGTLEVSDNLDAEVAAWLTTAHDVRVGGQRSTMGGARWEAWWVDDPQPPTVPSPRLSDGRVVMVLQSVTLLVDDHGFGTTDLASALEHYTSKGAVPRVWTRPTTVTGWNGVAGVPMATERALAAGSVAILDSQWTDDEVALIAAGIGIRQNEGYGEVSFALSASPSNLDLAGAWSQAAAEGKEPPGEASPGNPTVEPASREVCERLAEGLDPQVRLKVLNKVVEHARTLRSWIENGVPEGQARLRAGVIMREPWARDLGPDSRRDI